MKYSILTATAALLFSASVSAELNYVTGDIQHIDRENLEIAIAQKSGDIKEYKIDPSAAKEARRFKKGDSVTLELGIATLK